jgi:hypothetical protein
MDNLTNIFLHIKEQLQREVPEIKDTRIYNQQDLSPDAKQAFNTPSAFVEFSSIEYTSSNYDSQMSNIEVSVRVIDQGYTLNQLEVLALVDKVKWALQSYIGMNNIESFADSDWDNFYSWELVFELNLRECPQILRTQEVCGVDYKVELEGRPEFDILHSENCDACPVDPVITGSTSGCTAAPASYPNVNF